MHWRMIKPVRIHHTHNLADRVWYNIYIVPHMKHACVIGPVVSDSKIV